MKLCSYYQAHVERSQTLFFVATLRSHENLAFDRTLDKERGIFEFFVPESNEQRFLAVMQHYQETGIVADFKKLANRLSDPAISL